MRRMCTFQQKKNILNWFVGVYTVNWSSLTKVVCPFEKAPNISKTH